MSPYKALYGVDPPSVNYGQLGVTKVSLVDDFIKRRAEVQQLLRENLIKAQERMKYYADKKRSERHFKVGDEVYLKLQPYRQSSVNFRMNLKLSARYYGPYPITHKIGKEAYRLELPFTTKIHNVFHVSQLKKKLGRNRTVQTDLPAANGEGEVRIEPVAVLDRRLVKKGNRPAMMVLIQWSNKIPEDATWEDWADINTKFPKFDPWGQGAVEEQGSCQNKRD